MYVEGQLNRSDGLAVICVDVFPLCFTRSIRLTEEIHSNDRTHPRPRRARTGCIEALGQNPSLCRFVNCSGVRANNTRNDPQALRAGQRLCP